jgi:hypothetical protein
MSSDSMRKVLNKGKGVLQLTPTWVPRGSTSPGTDFVCIRTITLHSAWIAAAYASGGLVPLRSR